MFQLKKGLGLELHYFTYEKQWEAYEKGFLKHAEPLSLVLDGSMVRVH